MRHWHVSMTFEGDVEADTAAAAAKMFKAALGLPPESNRPDANMTGLSVWERPDVESEEDSDAELPTPRL